MRRFHHEFQSVVEMIDYGRMVYHGVFVPEEVLGRVPEMRGRRFRMEAEVGGVLLECGLMAEGKRRYVLLSKAFLKQADLSAGAEVAVRFTPVDGERVEVPLELEEALLADARAKEIWGRLSPGKRRGLAYRVAWAVQERTRRRRAEAVVDEVRGMED